MTEDKHLNEQKQFGCEMQEKYPNLNLMATPKLQGITAAGHSI